MAYMETNRSAAYEQAVGIKQHATGIFAGLRSALDASRRRQKLQHMPPHLLRDIGMSELDIAYLKSHDRLGVPMPLNTQQIR